MTKQERMLDKARQYTVGTYVAKFVSPEFQRMIRAEAGALPDGRVLAVVNGEIREVFRRRGYCVCVTCGVVKPWSSGLAGMHTGHFIGSRRFSILFEEANVAPQCSRCNRYCSGEQQKFRLWMETVRGTKVIERLERLRATSRQFTREELVDMRIDFKRRLADAERLMGQ